MKIKNINYYFIIGIFIVVFAGIIFSYSNFKNTNPTSISVSTQNLEARFISLNESPVTGSCGGLSQLSDGQFLQGACCGKMGLSRYKKQVIYLERYKDIKEIPKDPWNVSVSRANKLIEYDNTIKLTADQQITFNKALTIFDEGPCCCKCWRWYTFEGLAKYLIQEHKFNSQQIAELWAAEDVCGDKNPFEELKV